MTEKRIKNKLYRQFLDEGIIKTIDENLIKEVLDNIKGKHKKQARALLIALYYTGGRPVEVLNLKPKDIKREGSYIIINMPPSKNGLPRPVYLQFKRSLVKELYSYSQSLFKEIIMFHNFRCSYKRIVKTRTGEIKEYIEITRNLRYHVMKWFEGILDITPYFLRHNRFSKLAAKGVEMQELRMLKGAKTFASVMPYLHMSAASAKKVSKKID